MTPGCGTASDARANAEGALHDFNNAVQSLIASVSRLERSALKGDAGDRASMTAAIMDQVLGIGSLGAALARAASAGPDAGRELIPVDAFVRAFARQIPALLGDGIRLAVQVDAGGGAVACDPARLVSALRNLVLNARDAMPDGGVLVLRAGLLDPAPHPAADGGAAACPPPARRVAITVVDTGSGMDADALRRCFEPFVTTKEARGGTGLGLFQARAFATEMGGTVELQSRKGSGTEATLLLPCVTPPP